METRLRIGDLLVAQNLLTNAQRHRIVRFQARCGRPFGELAELLCGLSPTAIERAWVQQYVAYDPWLHLDTQPLDQALLPLVTRRQAWQFELLPLRREHGVLTIATSKQRLPRAAAFAWRHFREPTYLALAPRTQLRRHLARHYPWPAASGFGVADAVRALTGRDEPRPSRPTTEPKPVVVVSTVKPPRAQLTANT